jgi:GT2 family glycosyltransferase/membrane protein implicated in regulation of membrane protease activity
MHSAHSKDDDPVVIVLTGKEESVSATRPRAAGKFLFAGDEKLHVRGFTYGTFRRNPDGEPFPSRELVEWDFALMSAAGANAIRTYTPPPRWVLDTASRYGLRIMVGIPWEQHVAFLDDPGRPDRIEGRVRRAVRACAGHPAVLCYAVGNEIPAQIVRWTGRRRMQRHIRSLYDIAKSEDPDALVTYVSYPSTEYLDLDFLDLLCFNVYLESTERLSSYLGRLHNLAGDRPLLMGEVGLDSRTHGELGQACGLDAQIRAARKGGCAGAFVFSWTDEWHTGGHDIEEWGFGVTAEDRTPKPALASVTRAFATSPQEEREDWPRMSVVVCGFNAADTLRDCLEGALELRYPDYEVIVVDDGSTDATSSIASEFPFRLIRTENQGLSKARNAGIDAATGEIVAFVDADARPDPDWLTYLALTFERGEYAGVGGPNIAPGEDGWVADCVANAPGGPIHVLLSDEEAEHIPGCNMAFRREVLEEIGGFDPRFRVAGDDVDICWRVQDAGGRLGFSPAALVWHHPRDSVATYWRQQCGYGRAEALLEEKWPEKYNSVGHVTWGGRVYGGARPWFLARQGRIYHGVWGEAPFQAFHPARPSFLGSLAATPEWYLVLLALAGIAFVGVAWRPMLLALPLLALAAAPVLLQAALGGWRARLDSSERSRYKRIGLRALTIGLHLLQPAARLRGRLRHGLTPWRLRTQRRFIAPNPQTVFLWSESWANPSERLERLEFVLSRMRAVVLRGGPFDNFDLLVKGGASGRVRIHTCTEEHGAGNQLIRVRLLPTLSRAGFVALALTGGLSLWAFSDGAIVAGLMFALAMATVAVRGVLECGGATAAVLEALDSMHAAELGPDRRALERDARRVVEGGLGNGHCGDFEDGAFGSPEGEDEVQLPTPAPLDPPDRHEAIG